MDVQNTDAKLTNANKNQFQLKLASFLMMTTVLTAAASPVKAQMSYTPPGGSPKTNAVAATTTAAPSATTTPAAATQAPATANTGAVPTQQMPTVTVESSRGDSDGYQTIEPSLYKLTGPILDTPQSITELPRQLLDDQGNTTMRDALRNVPGVSIAAGEGGAQGDNLTIRGFSARSDFFLDAVRDFGSYYRDPFNLESIEVLKGPDSILFGRGSTGGVINQVTKQPELYNYTNGSFAFGTDFTRRATVDTNQKVGDTSAIRINMMGQDGNVAGRDGAQNSRFGFAPSFAYGIGTPTRVTFNYFHQSEDDIPDYGLPWFYNRPADVNRDNFYGFSQGSDTDYLRTDVDIGTAKIEHDFNSHFTLRDQLRVANYDRSARITEPQIPATPITTPLSSIYVNRNEIAVQSTETYVGDQLDLTSKFDTGSFKHTLISGLEVSHETSDPTRYTWTGVPNTSLVDPSESTLFSGTQSLRSVVEASADSGALYATDTMAITPKWDLIGGLRWDYVSSNYDQTVAPVQNFSRTDSMISWRTGLVYKPMTNGSIYFSAGNSFNPSIESLSLAANNANLPPEETMSYEVGTKWEWFNKRLMTTFALFRDEKTNARTTDPNDALLLVLSGKQRAQGFEFALNGHITDKWQIFGGYAFMDARVIQSNNPLEQGNPVPNAPKHSVTLWSTYDITKKWQVGGGLNAVSDRNSSTTPNTTTHVMQTAPGYVTFNVMAKYDITEKIAVQLNGYNLLDKFYYDQLHPAHVVPGAGRTFLITTNVKF